MTQRGYAVTRRNPSQATVWSTYARFCAFRRRQKTITAAIQWPISRVVTLSEAIYNRLQWPPIRRFLRPSQSRTHRFTLYHYHRHDIPLTTSITITAITTTLSSTESHKVWPSHSLAQTFRSLHLPVHWGEWCSGSHRHLYFALRTLELVLEHSVLARVSHVYAQYNISVMCMRIISLVSETSINVYSRITINAAYESHLFREVNIRK